VKSQYELFLDQEFPKELDRKEALQLIVDKKLFEFSKHTATLIMEENRAER